MLETNDLQSGSVRLSTYENYIVGRFASAAFASFTRARVCKTQVSFVSRVQDT